MEIFKFLFELLGMIYTKLNYDFFNFGFGWFDFLLASGLVVVIFNFLFQGFTPRGTVSGNLLDIHRNTIISNERRKKELLKEQNNVKKVGK